MDSINPYQSPGAPEGTLPAHEFTVGDGVFREGDLVVARNGAHLPDDCFVAGGPANTKASLEFHWLPPSISWLYWVIPMGYLVPSTFGLLSVATNAIWIGTTLGLVLLQRSAHRAQVTLSISSDVNSFARLMLFAQIASVVFGGGCFVYLTMWIRDRNLVTRAIAVVLPSCVFVLVEQFGARRRIARAVKISGDYVWLAGAGSAFLERLPEKPTQIV